MKNIVVCCDGTGNEFEVDQTNVLLLHSMLQIDSERQIAFYTPGVGTFSPTMAWSQPGQALSKTLGLALGVGYRKTVQDAYSFIVHHYEEGDRIFLFGFSRGAYAARMVAALIHGVGILQRGNQHLVPFAMQQIELRGGRGLDFAQLGRFRKQFSQAFDNRPFLFVGVWDTVSSISWAYDYLRYSFTASNPGVDVFRHAVSIDERRAFFGRNLLKHRPEQDAREVWFAGVHSDVGGGYAEAESGLSRISLAWMLVQARDVEGGGVLFDDDRIQKIVYGDIKPNHTAKLHNSLTWKWWLCEFFPKERFASQIPMPNLFRRRTMTAIVPDNEPVQNCVIHESAVRRKAELEYNPTNWPDEFDVEPWVPYFIDG